MMLNQFWFLAIMKILAHLCSLKHSPTVWIGGSLSFPRRSSWVMNQSSTVQLSASEKMMCQYCACCHDQQTLIMANLPFGKILLISESQLHRIQLNSCGSWHLAFSMDSINIYRVNTKCDKPDVMITMNCNNYIHSKQALTFYAFVAMHSINVD